MYRDDHAATHARLETIQRELASAQSQGAQDQQRIAMLMTQLAAAQQQLARMGSMPQAMHGYGYFQLPSRHSTVLVLGILSLVFCSALGPFAWSMGNEELRRIESGLTSPEGRSQAQAGRVCGIVSSALLGLGLVMMLFVMMASTR